MNRKNEKGLQFSVSFEGSPNERIPIAAHVFDRAGNHLESTDIDEKGQFRLGLSPKELLQVKVFIAPGNDERKIPSLNDLERISAYQPFLDRKYLDRDIIELFPIPELKYKYWWRCSCRVTGRVTKKVFSGGAWQVMPVCRARVHICEVDRWPIIIWRFPDDIIRKIREEIIRIKWPVPPIPDPGPLRDLDIPFNVGTINTRLTKIAAANTKAATKQISADSNEQFSFGLNSLKTQLVSTSSMQFIRQELSESFHLIHPYICYWPWIWKYFTSCDEKAVVETDGQGRFDAIVKYNCFGDRPDIYTWVEYFINGQWVTVYNPGRACHTMWNYTCGTEITINITDSRVPHCGRTDVIGEICEIMSIGNASYTSHILQRSAIQTVQGVSFDAKGLTDFYLAGLPGVRYVNPFGETLNVVADFGSTLHSSGVTHYRCSFKKNSDADVPSNWTIFNDPLGRQYEDEINDGVNPPFQQRKSFDLKDPSYSGLYIIPHHEASLQPGIPAPAGTLLNRDWMSEDFVIASIVSTNLQDGLYDFKFEFYRINAGTPEKVSVPKSTFQVPNPDDISMSLPLSNTTFTSAAYPDFHATDYLINDAGNAANAWAFKMCFRVNNDGCTAIIDNVTVINTDGTTTDSDTECGFASYTDKATSKVEFSFEASHPENFAVFGFGVIRGNGNPCPDADTSGMVIGNSSNGYVLSGGKYSKEVAVAGLLGNCDQAAFSENLHVYALATNGSRRLHEYDNGKVAAFAIEPASELAEASS